MDTQSYTTQLCSGLSDFIKTFAEVASEHGIKELPAYEFEVVWFRDVGGRGEEQRSTVREPDRWKLAELIDQLESTPNLQSSMRALVESIKSILKSGPLPVGLSHFSSERLAKSLLLVYLGKVGAFSSEPESVHQVCDQFVGDILSTSYEAKSIYYPLVHLAIRSNVRRECHCSIKCYCVM